MHRNRKHDLNLSSYINEKSAKEQKKEKRIMNRGKE